MVVAPRILTLAWLACGVSVAPAAVAQEQSSDATPTNIPVGQRDDIIVNGTRTAGSAIGATAPIAVLDSAAIKSLGASDLPDLMKRLTGVATSSSGADPAILLNGRRIAGFEDIQGIPPEAIDKVEILSEQDAARLGFSSTMRVMNFITKKHFRSLSAFELAGTTTEGGGGTSYSSVNLARIDGPRRVTIGASWFRQDPLLQSARPIAPDPDSLFAVGGNVVGANGGSISPALDALAGRPVTVAGLPSDPAARTALSSYAAGTANTDDIGAFRTLQSATDTLRLEGTYALPIGKDLNGTVTLSAQSDHNFGLNGLASGVLTVPAGSPYLPFGAAVNLYRYFPGTQLRQRNDVLALHAAMTLQGSARRWTWSVTSALDRAENRISSDNGIPLDALQASIASGGDPMAAPDPSSLANPIVSHSSTRTTTIVSKAVANGPLAKLPAGDAQLTVSVDYSRSDSDVGAMSAATPPSALDRSVASGSVNVSVPIASASKGVLPFLGQLSMNGTYGVSSVSNYGRLVNANAGLAWSPLPRFQITASIDDTRTAPSIAQLLDPVVVTPNVPFFDFTTGATVPVTTLSGGNPSLLAQSRRTATIGASLQPIKGKEIRFGVDYIDSRTDNQTTIISSATPAFQDAFPDLFVRNDAGQIVRVDTRPTNLANENERKLRFSLSLQTQLGPAPPSQAAQPAKDAPKPAPPKPRPFLFASINANYRLSDRLVLRSGLPALDLLDGATLDGSGGRPRWDVDGTVSLSYDPLSAGIYGRIQGPTRIRSDLAASDLRFSGRTWLVLFSSVDMEKLVRQPWSKRTSVFLHVENLLDDRIDVRDRTGAVPNRYQAAYLDPLGRSIRMGIRKLF